MENVRSLVRASLRIASVAVISAAALTAATVPASASPSVPLGVAQSGEFLVMPEPEVDREMAEAAALGAKWVRLPIEWRAIETAPGVYDWANTDKIVNAAKRHGLQIDGLIGYAPKWAAVPGWAGMLPAPRPADPAVFANFAGLAASRYAESISTWEVWNEANLSAYFAPSLDLDIYAQVLRQSYEKIHAAVKNVTVISGGLAPGDDGIVSMSPVNFINGMYARGLAGFNDGIALHPYTFPYTAYNDATGAWPDMLAVRDAMVRNGDGGKKIWITEFGAPTGYAGDSVNELSQADILLNSYRAAEQLDFMGPFFVYSVRDAGANPVDREDHFGLLRQDFSRKPAAEALAAEVRR